MADFVVLKDRGLDASRILLPTAGGADSELAAEIARALQAVHGSRLSILRVVDGPGERERGEESLARWAADHGFEDAALTVDDSGDVEGAIAREAADHSLVIVGATDRGLLSRLVTGSLHFDVVDEIGCSVVLAERPAGRGPLARLRGR